MSEQHKRIARVGLSGVVASVIDICLLIALVEAFGLPVAAAAFVAAMSGAAASFLVNKFWAFNDSSPVRATQVASFAGVALGSALGVAACVHVLSALGLPYLAAKAAAAVVIFVCWSYPVQSRVVFAKSVAA